MVTFQTRVSQKTTIFDFELALWSMECSLVIGLKQVQPKPSRSMFTGSTRALKILGPPYKVKNIFVSKYGNIYIKRCELKNVSWEKNLFRKSST